jgi:hypothetical protein
MHLLKTLTILSILITTLTTLIALYINGRVSIVTKAAFGQLDFRHGQGNFFPRRTKWRWSQHNLIFFHTVVLFPGFELPDSEPDHTSSSVVAVKNAWICVSSFCCTFI